MSKITKEDVKRIVKNLGESAHRFNGKTILITGGAGFIGNYMIDVLFHLNDNVLDKPCKIISLDNFATAVSYRTPPGKNLIHIKHDIKQPYKFEGDVDFIIHAAGIPDPAVYRDLVIETIDVGVFGTKNMLELAKEKKVESMIFFSSSEVYGDPDPEFVPTPEDYRGNVSCTGPRSNYDESKRLGEAYCVAYFQKHDVPVKMVRPFNVYGPGMRLSDRVIARFLNKVINKEKLQVYGSGDQTRTFCYASDGITGFFKALLSDKEGEPFNVGSDEEEITMEELAQLIVDVFNYEKGYEKIKGEEAYSNKSDPKRRCPDLTKLRSLGYSPQVSLREGIKRFYEHVMEEKV